MNRKLYFRDVETYSLKQIAEAIRSMIRRNPKYMVHGYDFFIVDNTPIPRPRTTDRLIGEYAVGVHSHLPSNWEEVEEERLREVVTTFSSDDIDRFRKRIRQRWGGPELVITWKNRGDWLSIPPDADPDRIRAFLKLSARSIYDKTVVQYEEKLRIFEQTGKSSAEIEREAVRDFCDEYDLTLRENLPLGTLVPRF